DLDGILEALVRLGSDLGDAGDGHGVARSAEGEGSGPIRDRAGPWAETPSGKRGAAEVAVGPDRAPRSGSAHDLDRVRGHVALAPADPHPQPRRALAEHGHVRAAAQ